MKWKNLNLVQRFSILSAIFICGVAIAIVYLITVNHEKMMIINETEATANLVSHLVDEFFILEEIALIKGKEDVYRTHYVSRLLLSLPEVIRIKIYNRDRVIIWSDQKELMGQRFPDNGNLDKAFSGAVTSIIEEPEKADNVFEKQFDKVFEIYVPIFGTEERPVAVVEVYQVPVAAWASIRQTSALVLLVVGLSGGLLYVGLLGIVRRAYRKQLALEAEVKESERLLTTSFNVMSDLITIIGSDARVNRANEAALTLFGPDIIGSPYNEPSENGNDLRKDSPALETLKSNEASSREIYSSRDGRYWDARSYPIKGSGGELQCVVEVIRDITEQKKLEEALRTSEENFQAIVAKSAEGILIVNQDGVVYYVNPVVEIFLDSQTGKLVNNKFQHTIKQEAVEEIDIIRKNGGKGVAEMRVVETIWKGETACLVTLSDVTENVELREKLRSLSITDELTGLSNRRGFLELAQHYLNVSKRTKNEMLLVFLDLDGLKSINDKFGHQEGDKALRDTAGILKKTFRESDIIARLGGDEFTVLATEATKGDAEFFTNRLRRNIDAYNREESNNFKLSLSMGLVPYKPESPTTIEEMLMKADELMYENKQQKKRVLE